MALRWGSLGSLLEAYQDPCLPEDKRRALLVGTTVGGSGKSLGAISSAAVYALLSRRDPEERIDLGK